MAGRNLIGALSVFLSLDSAEFEQGTARADRAVRNLQRQLRSRARDLQGLGQTLSKAITVPVAAVGAGIAAMAMEMANGMPELQRSAQLANVSVQEFQRLAFAAKSVGFEADKMADIYKDVNDKIGEFLATGGGEMADFFEHIAPKIGLTAEAFRGLSGPQALQLYYSSLEKAGVSQAQMTFYMEALANDATALIPLLRNGGEEMARLGEKAAVLSDADVEGLKRYNEASKEMAEEFRRLTITLAESGILTFVTNIVVRMAEWAAAVAKTNPELLKWGLIIGGVAATFGPFLLGVSGILGAFANLVPFLIKLTPLLKALATGLSYLLPVIAGVGRALLGLLVSPLGLVVGAVMAAVLVWQNWDKIKPYIDKAIGWVRDLFAGVDLWLRQKLAGVLNWVGQKVAWVGEQFFKLYDAVVGNSYVPDMVDGIGQHMARLQQEMVDPARKMTDDTRRAFAELLPILDRLFPELMLARADQYATELAKIEADATKLKWSLEQVAEAKRRLRAELLNDQVGPKATGADVVGETGPLVNGDEIAKAEAEWAEGWIKRADEMKAANDNLVVSYAEMARDIAGSLQGLVNNIRSGDWMSALAGVADIIAQVAGAIRGTAQPAQRTYPVGGTPPFGGFRAAGGPVLPNRTYMVGERGPELFVPGGAGSIVSNDNLRGGRSRVEIVPSPYFEVVVDGRVQAAAPGIARQGSMGGQQAVAMRASRRFPL